MQEVCDIMKSMDFFAFHYTLGMQFYLQGFINQMDYILNYFSPLLLLKTLFAPWKKMIEVDKSPGFNPQKIFEVFTFNLISRGIGAIVRLVLIFVSFVFIIFGFLGGAMGIVFWILLPFLGIPLYNKYQRRPENYIRNMMFDIKKSLRKPLEVVFSSSAGMFVLNHLGITNQAALADAKEENLDISKFEPESFTQLMEHIMVSNIYPDEFFRKYSVKKEDFKYAAEWWDMARRDETQIGGSGIGRPGLALELLFGYTPTLNQYSVDLSTPFSFSHHLIGRQDEVSRMERILTAGSSVIIIGPPGVGKKTVVLEFARRAASGQFGTAMAFRRVLEFDYNSLLSQAKDLNEKKALLAAVLEEAAYAGNIILMVRDIQRLTHSEVEGYDFTDIFEAHLEKRELKIIAITTPAEYERFIGPNLRLRKYLEKVEIAPPSKTEAFEILIESAKDWEARSGLVIRIPALRKILEESDRYITETPFPEKAIEILDGVITFVQNKKAIEVTSDDVNAVLAEKTGISFARLTDSEKTRLGKIETIIHEKLINQDSAVSLIGKSLRARTLGASDSSRPVGSFLFLGPTGVGKTETAKVLAKVYYGSEESILRFDMAEYSGREGLERLIGSQERNLPGALTVAIKNRPASLLLLDEIEKASKDIYNLFLALLDEGYITDAFGKKISGRHLFIIGTSNAGAEYIRQLVSKGSKKDELQKTVVNYVLENGLFSPEFLNRFDGVIVYEPLDPEVLFKVAKLMLQDFAKKLKEKGLYLEISDEIGKKLAEDGYDPAFGARPMRRIVDLTLGDLVGKALLSGEIKEGNKIKILPGVGKNEYKVEIMG